MAGSYAADGSFNVTVVGGSGGGTANPNPGSDYAKDTKQPNLVGGRIPTDGSGVTQPISAAALPLPAGAATQTTLAQVLTATQTAAQLFIEDSAGGANVGSNTAGTGRTTNIAASSNINGANRDAGAGTSPYTLFQASIYSPQAGNAFLQSSSDGVNFINLTNSTAITAGVTLYLSSKVVRRYYRVIVQNGSTAASNVDVATSFTLS